MVIMTATPQPEIDGLQDRLNEARKAAYAGAAGPEPSVAELTAFAAIAAVIELTGQIHHLTLATREQTAELQRQARSRSEQS